MDNTQNFINEILEKEIEKLNGEINDELPTHTKLIDKSISGNNL